MGTDEFKDGFELILKQLPAGVLQDFHFFDLSSRDVPWLDSGIDIQEGDRFSSFAIGRTTLSGTQIWIGPHYQLWFRVGEDGEVFRGTRDTHSWQATCSGRLYLASYFPGEWADVHGSLATPNEAYGLVEGGFSLLLIRWNVEPRQGLEHLRQLGDVEGLLQGELDRLANGVEVPEGWKYLWFIGPAEIYRKHKHTHGETMCCNTENDVGLLQQDVDVPLVPDAQLRWAWKVDLLPSEVAEDTLLTHDYMSIAVEFDNGQDITYYWSAGLPVGAGYRCPIPSWTARETHVVIRSGGQELGKWLNEQRNLYEDYAKYIGGAMPGRIVRVWLIALSLFQHRPGKCEYQDIELLAEGRVVPIK
ncbi:DUF3047 domain-containing protein [Methylobacillus arboreus]|uniref:DUF3047 domain-containing protein n=1 Tax=Methylobacillus arboreus TaxID=755170 RepID=UPI001E658D0D|nr:DUF3047 domain-containing protein [Methylobacillus arboreus]MCB5190532.1 DUF3047 domain-containing protein [Methylobacillus arboreus]